MVLIPQRLNCPIMSCLRILMVLGRAIAMILSAIGIVELDTVTNERSGRTIRPETAEKHQPPAEISEKTVFIIIS